MPSDSGPGLREAAVQIRQAAPEDLEAVSGLLAATWHDTYDPLIGHEKVTEITSAWHSVETLRPQLHLPATSFLVAEVHGGLVGHLFANGQSPPVLSISRLYVLPSRQRSGIGTQLLASAIRRHPEVELVTLEVQADNAKAMKFYTREGFRPAGERMEQGLRHIRMEKPV